MLRIVFNGSGGASDGGNGRDGFSAYQIALANGFTGTEEEWLDSLHGKDGKDGANGADGFGTKAQYDAIIARLDALEATENGGA